MKNDLLKRVLALALSFVLLLGNIPATAFATEEKLPEVTETVTPEETSAPTVPVTEPVVQETVAPTEPPVPEETVPATEPVPTEIMGETVTNDPALAFSGTCGAKAAWTLDAATGILTISGTGDMENYGIDASSPTYSNHP